MTDYYDKRIVEELTAIRRAVEDVVDAFKMLARTIAPDRAEEEILKMMREASARDEREAAEKYRESPGD